MKYRSAILMSIGVWALLLAIPAVSRADVVFSNFGAGFSYNTGAGNFIGNGLDGSGSNYAEGDTFTPTTTATFTSLEIALSNFFGPTNTDRLAVSLDANSGDAPGATLESFIVAPGTLGTLGNNNAPIVLNSVLMPVLTAGTQYWVTVSDQAGVDSNVWNWNSTGDMSDEAISTDGGSTWFSPSGLTPGAYQVNGVQSTATPEPSASWFVIGLFAASAALFRKWRIQ